MSRSNAVPESRRPSRFSVRPLFVALVAAGVIAPAGVHAARIPVQTGGDAGNASTCTLRQAAVALNTASLAGTICANSGAGFGISDTIDLTIPPAATITLAGAVAIPVGVTTRIEGPGSTLLTISGANASRVFENFAGGILLELSRVTVANGLSQGAGGCIYMYDGTARLEESVVTGCTAQHDPSGPPYLNGIGGGISAGSVDLVQSTVSGNTAATAGGGVSAIAVYAYRSVISGNTVSASSCDKYDRPIEYCATALVGGGGILAVDTVNVVSSTISGNIVNVSHFYNSDDNSVPTFRWGIGGGISQVGNFVFLPPAPAIMASEKRAISARSPLSRGHAATRGGAAKSKLQATFSARAGAKALKRPKADGSVIYGLGVRDSTISGNRIVGLGGQASDFAKYGGAGAFFKYQGENAEIANSTVSGNRLPANSADSIYSVGSGLLGDSFELNNSTVTGNVGPVAVFAKYNIIMSTGLKSAKSAKSAKLTKAVAAFQTRAAKWRDRHGVTLTKSFAKAATNPIMNSTIVADNQAQDYDVACPNCTITGANNLIQFPDGNQPIDTIVGLSARLAPLADRGGVVAGAPGNGSSGPTMTHALYSGSPAINNGNNLDGFPYDQRGPGFARTIPSGTDIGAFEGSVLAPAVNTVPVPVLGPWMLGLLSALLGAIGLNRRRRRT